MELHGANSRRALQPRCSGDAIMEAQTATTTDPLLTLLQRYEAESLAGEANAKPAEQSAGAPDSIGAIRRAEGGGVSGGVG